MIDKELNKQEKHEPLHVKILVCNMTVVMKILTLIRLSSN